MNKIQWLSRIEDVNVRSKALDLINDPNFSVDIVHNFETGEWLWAVTATNCDEFWLDAFPTKEEAVSLANNLGWNIRNIYFRNY